MAVKIIGAVLVILSGWGLGNDAALRWRGRLALLENVRRMIYLLKGEIVYANSTLQEALERVGRRDGGEMGELFVLAAGDILEGGGESFSDIWARRVDGLSKKCFLNGGDREGLKELGANLGFLDTGMQERVLLLYLERLDGEIVSLKGEVRERCRLYTGLGLMAGLFLAVVMV